MKRGVRRGGCVEKERDEGENWWVRGGGGSEEIERGEQEGGRRNVRGVVGKERWVGEVGEESVEMG